MPSPHELAPERRYRLAATLLLLALVAWPAVRWAQAQGGVEEPEWLLKLNMIYTLANYTTWPSKAFKQQNEPFVLGVLGGDNASSVAVAFKNKTVSDKAADLKRPIVVRHFDSVEAVTACHLLFVMGTETRLPSAALKRLAANNTLTVGEHNRFLDDGGMVRFSKSGKQVEWDINVAAVTSAELLPHPLLFQKKRVN